MERVMVIDDDTIFRFIIKKQIEKYGRFEIVHESNNGEEGIEYLQNRLNQNQELPQAIILDLDMPVMNGWEFLEAFKDIFENSEKSIPICILSSTINQADFEKAKEYTQVKEFFSKPIQENHLNALENLIKS